MQARPASKYHLKDLYREIGFYDRKIAYCQNFEKFDSEEERSRAVEKLTKKRKTLVQAAAEMAGAGIECDPSLLPPSLKSAEPPALRAKTPAATTAVNKVASSA
jgi:hypothetical protein